MSEIAGENICPICRGQLEEGDDVVQIRQKGADDINAASVQRVIQSL